MLLIKKRRIFICLQNVTQGLGFQLVHVNTVLNFRAP